MTSCKDCGAGLDANDKECPYCGCSVIQPTEGQGSMLGDQEGTYRVDRDEDGGARVRFGEGQTGRRPPTGKSTTAAAYRRGAGTDSRKATKHIEEKLDQLDRQIESVPDPSKQQGSKDMGVALVEYFSTIGDLLSEYQSSVADEAHLSTDDRERRSLKEQRMKPKLRSIMTFCERADSKTKKKLGLSDADIHKIKTTAAKALQMTESGKCSKCGAKNQVGATQCLKCGAPL